MDRGRNAKVLRLQETLTKVKDIEPTVGDAAEVSVKHCIITFCKGLSRIRTAGRSALNRSTHA